MACDSPGEVADRLWPLVLQRLDVQHSDFDAPLCEHLDDAAADAVAAAGHDDDLLLPVVEVADAVVEDPAGHPGVEDAEDAQGREDGCARGELRMVGGEEATPLGEAAEEVSRQGEGGVEEGAAKEREEDVGVKAFAGEEPAWLGVCHFILAGR